MSNRQARATIRIMLTNTLDFEELLEVGRAKHA